MIEEEEWLVELEVMSDHLHPLVAVYPQHGGYRPGKAAKRTCRVLREGFRTGKAVGPAC
ncbi:hypothetical protein [Nonomuraea turcica]|uniref:hypothetical protein n=1 Tax=Nonomuraea sp. G32 TaxID=3067274 RepID=UPI00273C405C|nr:hypothetical protein [Nonomuraea sp. G32]MDP4509924.1 hypothetical protein [Nonomuraea sp. G32]